MYASALGHTGPQAIDLNGTSTPLHWSFLYISVANLIVISVMVVIFGAALLIRFPHKAGSDLPAADSAEDPALAAAAADPGDAGMWTAKVRTGATKLLPPKKLLPDRQPAYVASWIYVFGVASLVALEDGTIVSAALLSTLHEMPLVAYLFTDPAWKGRGLAEGLLRPALHAITNERREHRSVYVACASEHLDWSQLVRTRIQGVPAILIR
jgi:GNAT superfamily N-acetyltransferase